MMRVEAYQVSIRTALGDSAAALAHARSVIQAQLPTSERRAKFIVAVKHAAPDGRLLSELIAGRDDRDGLSEDELVSMAVLLLIAGHETTTSLIGNVVLALLRHLDQLAALREDPDLLSVAIDEILRFESPAAMATIRFTAEPVTIGGVTILGEQIATASGRNSPALRLRSRLPACCAGSRLFGWTRATETWNGVIRAYSAASNCFMPAGRCEIPDGTPSLASSG